MQQLIQKMLLPAFDNPLLAAQHDGAVFEVGKERLAFTTDSYVVQPLFFPGGDIGKLAIHGTVNDLAMCGADPLWLSVGLIIEEGFPMEDLWRVVHSMKLAADQIGVQVVTGDTKVVDKGKGDGLFINTAGIGVVPAGISINPGRVQPGDLVLLSGDIGRHGIAIMAEREGLEFESTIESDSAPLSGPVQTLLAEGIEIHCLRDLTRGGLASALIESAQAGKIEMNIDERAIPVRSDVQGACEILGLDPLYVANEGRFLAMVAPGHGTRAMELMGDPSAALGPVVLGEVGGRGDGTVIIKTAIGGNRILDLLSGEQLPRIC